MYPKVTWGNKLKEGTINRFKLESDYGSYGGSKKKKKEKGPGTSWYLSDFKSELKELSTLLIGKVSMIRSTLRSKLMAPII